MAGFRGYPPPATDPDNLTGPCMGFEPFCLARFKTNRCLLPWPSTNREDPRGSIVPTDPKNPDRMMRPNGEALPAGLLVSVLQADPH